MQPDPDAKRPDTDDLLDETKRRLRARRRRLPLWLQAGFAVVDMVSLLGLPWAAAIVAVRTGSSDALAAYGAAGITTWTSFRFWIKRSPLLLDHGLEAVDEGTR